MVIIIAIIIAIIGGLYLLEPIIKCLIFLAMLFIMVSILIGIIGCIMEYPIRSIIIIFSAMFLVYVMEEIDKKRRMREKNI